MLSDILVLCIARTTDRQIVEQGRAGGLGPEMRFSSVRETRRTHSRRLDEPDPENIISNPSEGKIYERVALSHRIGAPRRLQSLVRKKYTFQRWISVRVLY